MFFFKGRGPLRPLCFLREREETPSDWGFLSLPKTLTLLPDCLRAVALKNPGLVLRRWGVSDVLCVICYGKSRVGGDSVESFKVCSLPPNQTCSEQKIRLYL